MSFLHYYIEDKEYKNKELEKLLHSATFSVTNKMGAFYMGCLCWLGPIGYGVGTAMAHIKANPIREALNSISKEHENEAYNGNELTSLINKLKASYRDVDGCLKIVEDFANHKFEMEEVPTLDNYSFWDTAVLNISNEVLVSEMNAIPQDTAI